MAIIIGLAFGVLFISGYSLVLAFPVKWLWNYAAVSAVGAHSIDFWHALALCILCGILFRNTSSSSQQKESKTSP